MRGSYYVRASGRTSRLSSDRAAPPVQLKASCSLGAPRIPLSVSVCQCHPTDGRWPLLSRLVSRRVGSDAGTGR
jgi:hypothetical protein